MCHERGETNGIIDLLHVSRILRSAHVTVKEARKGRKRGLHQGMVRGRGGGVKKTKKNHKKTTNGGSAVLTSAVASC